MSRNSLTPKNKNHSVVVGWDNGMKSFFATVIDREVERLAEEATLRVEAAFEEQREPSAADSQAANRDPVVFWIGAARIGEVQTVEELTRLLEPYADVSPEMAETLRGDRAREEQIPDTDHQRQMRRFIADNTRT